MTTMVDLHSHIMYGWDDGAETLSESMAMARIAAEDGIRTIAATPHMYWADKQVDPGVIRERVAHINQTIEDEGLDLRVVVGTEVPAFWDHIDPVRQKKVLTLNDSRTLLFEVPFQHLPVRFNDLIFQVRMLGIMPLMAHPERSEPFLADQESFRTLINEDIPVQVTGGSLTGFFGGRVQEFAWDIVSQERPIVIASDGHSSGRRRPTLSDAHAALTEAFGREAADLMCRDNATALIENRMPRIADIPRRPTAEERKGFTARLRKAMKGKR